MLYAAFDYLYKNLVESYTSSVMMWGGNFSNVPVTFAFHCQLIKFSNFLTQLIVFYTSIAKMFYLSACKIIT